MSHSQSTNGVEFLTLTRNPRNITTDNHRIQNPPSKMVSPDLSRSHLQPPPLTMAKQPTRAKPTSSLLFIGGAFAGLLMVYALWSFVSTNPGFSFNEQKKANADPVNLRHDPPDPTFYDDPRLSYSIDRPIRNWDDKRREWMKHHPSFSAGARAGGGERIVVVTGSQATPCKNPIGDHLLLRFFKNKVDYCRIHGYDVFYNNVLLHPEMHSYWAKIPAVRAAMVAHPEAEWIWWVDSDAAFTDMDFKLPLERYKNHNLVVHGWKNMIYEEKSWVSINAGVFLIRNCQWSLEFMEVWASMGPQSPNYDKWGKIQKATFRDKFFPESDDQSGLVYLLLKEKEKWGDKIYVEGEYYFEGYWLEIVGTLDNITEKYVGIEKEVPRLRRRHAEKVREGYAEMMEPYLKEAGYGRWSWRRPFITHFTGCQPCSGKHNKMYSGKSCWDGMQRALNFADNQVLRSFGYVHPDLLDSSSVSPLPFDSPA